MKTHIGYSKNKRTKIFVRQRTEANLQTWKRTAYQP